MSSVASPADSSASATTGSPPDDSMQNLHHVINSIHKTLAMLHQLYVTMSSFNVVSQLPFLQRQNTLVLEFDNMVKLAEKCDIQGLRKHLLDELEEAFPDEVEAYRMIRATSAAEAKQLAQAQNAFPNGDVKFGFSSVPNEVPSSSVSLSPVSSSIITHLQLPVIMLDLLRLGSSPLVLEPYSHLARLQSQILSQLLLHPKLRPRLRLKHALQRLDLCVVESPSVAVLAAALPSMQ
nr:mediator of RNA polymerase II transcription subunit 10B-like [Ipomoea batatas]